MADLANYQDKLLQDDQNQNQNGSSSSSGDISGPYSGGLVSSSNQSNTAGVGAGGVGGWTNIQSYLDANKSSDASGNLLNDKAGSTYDSEKSKLDTSANDTKLQADNESKKINDAKDNSKEWVNQAANAYSWTGNQNADYTNNTNKLKSAINDSYSGPKSFDYTKSNDFQRYNDSLKDDNSFGSLMNDFYREKAGGSLNQGQAQLQNQFDVNNENLANVRKSLLDKYAGFDTYQNGVLKDTDSYIQNAQNNYLNNQSALKDYMGNMGNDYQQQIDKAEADARAAYNDEYTASNQTPFYNSWSDDHSNNGSMFRSWEQAQKLLDYKKSMANKGWTFKEDTDPGRYFLAAEPALKNFYDTEDKKYANTADKEERNWNTIMDILGNSARKQQGFKVRG